MLCHLSYFTQFWKSWHVWDKWTAMICFCSLLHMPCLSQALAAIVYHVFPHLLTSWNTEVQLVSPNLSLIWSLLPYMICPVTAIGSDSSLHITWPKSVSGSRAACSLKCFLTLKALFACTILQLTLVLQLSSAPWYFNVVYISFWDCILFIKIKATTAKVGSVN